MREIRYQLRRGRDSRQYTPVRCYTDPVTTYTGGLSVAVGDAVGTGTLDIITAAAQSGQSWVRAYDRSSVTNSLLANTMQAFPEPAAMPNGAFQIVARDGDRKAESGKRKCWWRKVRRGHQVGI